MGINGRQQCQGRSGAPGQGAGRRTGIQKSKNVMSDKAGNGPFFPADYAGFGANQRLVIAAILLAARVAHKPKSGATVETVVQTALQIADMLIEQENASR